MQTLRLKALTSCGVSALMFFLSACSALRPPIDKQAFNLVADSRDQNGLYLNPQWNVQYQQHLQGDEIFQLPDPEKLCGGFPITTSRTTSKGGPQCTTDDTKVDRPDTWHKAVCNLEPVLGLFKGKLRFGKFHGHVNWWPATYEGALHWHGKSGLYPLGDDDYNFELQPLLESKSNPAKLVRRGNGVTKNRPAIHVEFNGDEVIGAFDKPEWESWERFRDKPAYAVVTGLFGLDAEHESYTELHPVYALAVQTECDEQPDPNGVYQDTWMIFIRNWGNEGFCGGWDIYHKLNLTEGVFTFSLRLPGAESVSYSQERTEFWADRKGGVGPHVQLAPDGVRSAALVRFKLPVDDPDQPGVQLPSRLHGTLILEWKGNPPADRCQLPTDPPQAVAKVASLQDAAELVRPPDESEDDAESFLEELPSLPSEEVSGQLEVSPPPPPPPPPPPTFPPSPSTELPTAPPPPPPPPPSVPTQLTSLLKQGPLGEPILDIAPVSPGQVLAVTPANNDRDEFFPPQDLQALTDSQLGRRCLELRHTADDFSDLDAIERQQEKREYCQELYRDGLRERLGALEERAQEKVCSEALTKTTKGLTGEKRQRLENLQNYCRTRTDSPTSRH